MPDILEALILLVLLVGVGLVVFAGGFPSDIQNYPLEFLCVPFFLWAAFRFGRREVATALAVVSGIAVWGTMREVGPFARETTQESLILVQSYISVIAVMFVVLAAVVAEHKIAEGQLRELAITDPLTGLANYRRLLEVLRGEITRSRRTGRSFSVVFVDMDGLKSINDRFGHLVGSRALCRLGDALRRTSRALDTPARYGGDEFAIVLPETTEDGAKSVLKRITDRLLADPDKPVALGQRRRRRLPARRRLADDAAPYCRPRALHRQSGECRSAIEIRAHAQGTGDELAGVDRSELRLKSGREKHARSGVKGARSPGVNST